MTREYTSGIVTNVTPGKQESSVRLLNTQTRSGSDLTINGYVPKHLNGNFIDYHERTLNNKTYQVIQTEFVDETRSHTNTYTYRKDGSDWRMRILYDTGIAQKAKQLWSNTKKADFVQDTKELSKELSDRL